MLSINIKIPDLIESVIKFPHSIRMNYIKMLVYPISNNFHKIFK